MNSLFPDIRELWDAIEAGALILTPNHRSSVQLLDAYGALRRQRGLPAVCRSPRVHAVDIWVRQCWDELFSSGSPVAARLQVMPPAHEQMVWKTILQSSAAGELLLSPDAAARNVQAAYTLMQQWDIPLAQVADQVYLRGASEQPQDDEEVFLHWLQAYEQYTADQHLISLSLLLRKVIEAVSSGAIAAPARLICVGFRNPPPLYRRLLQALMAAAGEATQFQYPENRPLLEKFAAPDAIGEYRAAAQWAHELVTGEPEAKVGIICPDIHARAADLDRIFGHVFHPAALFSLQPVEMPAYSLSAGGALIDTPLVATALGLLALNAPVVDTLALCHLLRSPFLAGAQQEAAARAALELHLRKRGEQQVGLADVRSACQREQQPYYSPCLGQGLQQLETLRRQGRGKRLCRDWLPLLEEQLAGLGWPGERRANPAEAQQQQRWHQLLGVFQETTFLQGKVALEQALALLGQLAGSSHAGSASPEARVQILSPVEADGLQFTHIWFMGLSEQNWPPAARPNPFLPLALQKRQGLPEASPALQTRQARELLENMRASCAAQMVLSYPRQDGEMALKPCALIKDLGEPARELEALSGAGLPGQVLPLLRQAAARVSADPLYIPLQPVEEVGGGTALIGNQAACPFKSFASHRLHATELPALNFGLPPLALGIMLHRALEMFWRELRDQQSLLMASSDALDALIQAAVADAVKAAARQYPQTLQPRFAQIEAQRLEKLLRNWLAEEGRRGSFEIAALEHPLQWRHAGLSLNFRIDRVERFADGSVGLVDYKSGRVSPPDWLDARQDQPQLPLYLLAAEHGALPVQQQEQEQAFANVSSVLYAQINIEDMKFRGISNREEPYPGLARQQRHLPAEMDWEELKAFWQQSLQALAQEFLDGYVAVDPKGPQSCQYCHLDSLCRIRDEVTE